MTNRQRRRRRIWRTARADLLVLAGAGLIYLAAIVVWGAP
jgi:hypothetical protein